jgi:hypothetical protein
MRSIKADFVPPIGRYKEWLYSHVTGAIMVMMNIGGKQHYKVYVYNLNVKRTSFLATHTTIVRLDTIMCRMVYLALSTLVHDKYITLNCRKEKSYSKFLLFDIKLGELKKIIVLPVEDPCVWGSNPKQAILIQDKNMAINCNRNGKDVIRLYRLNFNGSTLIRLLSRDAVEINPLVSSNEQIFFGDDFFYLIIGIKDGSSYHGLYLYWFKKDGDPSSYEEFGSVVDTRNLQFLHYNMLFIDSDRFVLVVLALGTTRYRQTATTLNGYRVACRRDGADTSLVIEHVHTDFTYYIPKQNFRYFINIGEEMLYYIVTSSRLSTKTSLKHVQIFIAKD